MYPVYLSTSAKININFLIFIFLANCPFQLLYLEGSIGCHWRGRKLFCCCYERMKWTIRFLGIYYLKNRTGSLPKTVASQDITNTPRETAIFFGHFLGKDRILLPPASIRHYFIHYVPPEKTKGKLTGKCMLINGNWPGIGTEPRLSSERKQINRMKLMETPNNYASFMCQMVFSVLTPFTSSYL